MTENRIDNRIDNRIEIRSGFRAVVLVVAVCLTAGTPQRSWSWQQRVVSRAVPQETAADEQGPGGLEGAGEYLGGAPLKTDPDLMAQLDRAEQYRSEGNYRVVAKLWQSVLDQSGDTLYTDDGETYFALTHRIESMLAELPAEGLSAYRISADADASEILAAAGDDRDLDALNRVVRGYFMSSLGDDAAFRLGCIYLDRHDFTGAVRMFKRIVDRYPDPSVPLDQVWLRIAIAYAYAGARDSAVAALQQAVAAGADNTDRLRQAVEGLVAELPELNPAAAGDGQTWSGRLGGADRMGVMPVLPDPPSGKLRALYQYWYTPRDQYLRDQFAGDFLVREGRPGIEKTLDKNEKKLVADWRKSHWRPGGQMLFDRGRVVWKTGADLMALDPAVLEHHQPVWRSVWLNQFLVDDATDTWKQMFDAYGRYGDEPESDRMIPSRIQEVQLFGDRIAQDMSLHQDVVYSIEGSEYSDRDNRVPARSRDSGYNWGTVPRRTRTNRLVAYDIETGKMLWSQPPAVEPGSRRKRSVNRAQPDRAQPDEEEPVDVEERNPFEEVGYMAAPVGYGDLILVPVNISGSIWIYAMDTANHGELVWRSYLCDEPGGGSQAWSPIRLALDGSTVYALCGTGVVFAVDAMTGTIRFARRHRRTGEPNQMMQRFGNQMELLEFDGWQEDTVIPAGNVLLVLASDYNAVWAIDRQTAEFVWRTDNRPFGRKFDYLIGIHGDHVYLGGVDSIAAISLSAQGRWEWVHSLPEPSCGQAMLTADALYVPVGSTIQKLGLQGKDGGGDLQATFEVELGTGAPVGNLFSDGEKFWVAGANRLYVLGDDDGSIVDQETPPADQESGGAGDQPQAEDGEGGVPVSPVSGPVRYGHDRRVSAEGGFETWPVSQFGPARFRAGWGHRRAFLTGTAS